MLGELLVILKDLGGFRYSEISKLSPFDTYRLTSMAKLYRDKKRRLSKTLANKVGMIKVSPANRLLALVL